MQNPSNKFLSLIQNPLKFTFFLLKTLPAAYFSGVRLKYADHSQCMVTVPYKWLTRNPFKSTYFACLAMAAEMSTGILAMMKTWQIQPAISLLVVKVEGTFQKKATGITTFICEDGPAFEHAVNEAAASGKSTTIAARSTGKDLSGEIIAEFVITWSFKARTG
ncbi:MAG: thioesterase [Ferruginibacter sp.]